MDQEHFPSPVSLRQACQKLYISLAAEYFIVFKVEAWAVQVDRSEDFLSIALSGGRNQRLLSSPSPGLIQSGVLAKTGFISKKQRCVVLSGFFLASDRCSAAIDPAISDRLWPTAAWVVAPKIPAS